MAYANITFKGVAIAAPVPFGMVTSLNGHDGHHAACLRHQRRPGHPQNVGVSLSLIHIYCALGKGKTLCPANGAFKQKAPAAGQRLPQGLSPFCAESAGTLLAPQKKTLYFFAGFRYTETNGRKQSL